MVFIAVRTDFTTLTVQNAAMFAQETSSIPMQEPQDLNAAGDAAVNQQKSSRKRTKTKKKKVGAQVQLGLEESSNIVDVDSGIIPNGHVDEGGGSQQTLSVTLSQQTLTDSSPREDQSVSLQPESILLLDQSSHTIATNTYAAAVSGRKLKDSLDLTGSLSVESTTAFPSIPMISSQPLQKSNSANSLPAVASKCGKECKDVGVQASSPNQTKLNVEAEPPLKYTCQETMTSGPTGCKNKAVLAKLCGCNDNKYPPPVEFHGRCFTFENTIAKQFAEMGISFFAEQDEETNNPGIY